MNKGDLISDITKIPLTRWSLHQCIILDWYDAPFEGFCELNTPKICFYFKACAIKSNNLSLDSFLYEIYIDNNMNILSALRNDFNAVSIPLYPFWNPYNNSDLSKNKNLIFDTAIQELIAHFKKKDKFILQSKAMNKFTSLWQPL